MIKWFKELDNFEKTMAIASVATIVFILWVVISMNLTYIRTRWEADRCFEIYKSFNCPTPILIEFR